MTLYDIARKNIFANTKRYILYFYPMTSSILLYFTFLSLKYNQQINESAAILDKIGPAFTAASILLFLFAASFIWYSNAYFTKTRKQEIGLYSLFGMQKKQIAKLLFFENLLVGILSLFVGLLLGVLLSKLFAMLLIKLMGFSIVAEFTIAPQAIVQTIIAFMITILITSLHNYRIIYRYSLLQLFKAQKKSEQEPKSSVILAFLSILLIGAGYYIFLQPSDTHSGAMIVTALFAIILGSYLCMRTFITYLIKKLFRRKKFAWKGIHLISLSHLLFRIKGNVLTLTIIALLTTFTLFLLGTTFGLYSNLNKVSSLTNPQSYMYSVQNEENQQKIAALIKENGDSNLLYSVQVNYLQTDGDLSATRRYPDTYPITLIPNSDYQRLAKAMGYSNPASVTAHQALVFYDGNLDQKKDPYTNKDIKIKNELLTIASYQKYSLLNLESHQFPVVISDSLFEQIQGETKPNILQIYKIKNEQKAKKLNDNIYELLTKDEEDLNNPYVFSSHYNAYHIGFETYGLLIFISGFLGIVFLIATGSILHYKLLTEASLDQTRYQILKKIGMSAAQIRQTIKNQVLFIYLLPLFLATAHSTIMIQAVSTFLDLPMLLPLFLAIGTYTVIYAGYFFLTVSHYQKTALNE